ncbi:hypothetical protein RSW84_26630, partial [Escherichia coli]|uniref:hypothetical protein n=1 Tax=Escherichia coli TaxID=562 RepID=UPI0028DEA74B
MLNKILNFSKNYPMLFMHKKAASIQKIVFTGLVLAFLFLINGCLSKFDNYGVVDTMVSNPSNSSITVLVAENNAMSYQKNGGFVKT